MNFQELGKETIVTTETHSSSTNTEVSRAQAAPKVTATAAVIDVLAGFALEKLCPDLPLVDDPRDPLLVTQVYQAAQQIGVPIAEVFEVLEMALEGYMQHQLLPHVLEVKNDRHN